MTKQKITPEELKLVFAYGYLVEIRHDPNSDYFGVRPPLPVSGYYVGSTTKSPGGSFSDLGNLVYACAAAAQISRAWSIPVDMTFEGMVRTKTMTVLLQPIQINPIDYKNVDELSMKYLKK